MSRMTLSDLKKEHQQRRADAEMTDLEKLTLEVTRKEARVKRVKSSNASNHARLGVIVSQHRNNAAAMIAKADSLDEALKQNDALVETAEKELAEAQAALAALEK